MSSDTRRIKVVISGESTGAEQALGRTEQAGKKTASAMGKVSEAFDKFGPGLLAATGLEGAKEVFEKVVGGAVDLQLAVQKNTVIFGAQADAVDKWSQHTAQSIGISRQAALDGASDFGNLFKQFGIGQGQVAGMSEKLVELSANFAAWKGDDPARVMEAMRAATRGEYDALQRFIPSLSDAAIKQKALNETGKTNVSTLTNAEKAMALYTIITQEGGAASTFLSKATHTAAFEQQKFKAELTDTAANIGSHVLPAYSGFLRVVNDIGPITSLGLVAELVFGRKIVSAIGSSVGSMGNFKAGVQLASEEMGRAFFTSQNMAASQTMVNDAVGKYAGIIGGTRGVVQAAAADGQYFRSALLGIQGAASLARVGIGSVISALGGPWVVAITVATAGISYLIGQSDKAKAATDALSTSAGDYAQTLKSGLTPESVEAAKSMLAHNSALRGLVTAMDEAGVSTTTLVRGLNGDKDARTVVIDAMNKQIAAERLAASEARNGADADTKASKAHDDRADKMEKARIAFAKQNTTMQESNSLTDNLTQEMDQTAVSFTKASGEVKSYADALTVLNDKTSSATDKSNALKNAEDALYGKQRTLSEAQEAEARGLIELNKTLDDVFKTKDKSQIKSAKSLDMNTESGLKSRDAIEAELDAINANFRARVANGVGIDEANRKHDQEIEKLRKAAEKKGIDKKALEDLIKVYGAVPTITQTDMRTSGFDATKAQLQELLAYQYALKNGVSLAEARIASQPNNVFSTGGKGNSRGSAFASGGFVSGKGTSTSDEIDAKLSTGEYVQRAAAVDFYGKKFMDDVNNMTMPKPKFAGGGFVEYPFPATTKKAKVPTKAQAAAVIEKMFGAGTYDGPITPTIASAQSWLKGQEGKPYIWDSAGPRGYDCSGLVSAVYNIMHGHSPYSHTFSTSNEGGFFPKKGHGMLTAGWSNPGQAPASSSTGHTAGNLAGLQFESRGSVGVVLGKHARSVDQFAHVGTYDQGGVLKPGTTAAANWTGQNEYVLTGSQLADAAAPTVNVTVNVAGNVTAEKDLAASIATAVRDELIRHARRNGGKSGL